MLALSLVAALAPRFRLTIGGPSWARELYAGLGRVVSGPDVPRDAAGAVLVKPAFRAAWQARHLPRRVGWATDHRRPWLTDVVPQPGPHRWHDMAALGEPLGVSVHCPPRLATTPLGQPGVVLLPLSATGATVEWSGFRALADALRQDGQRVVFGAGPGQSGALARHAGSHAMLPELGVAAMARVLAAADAVVGNDSGLTHLAVAARRGAGRSPAAVVGVAGSTDPARTGALGAQWQVGPRLSCAPCYASSCGRGLGCLAVPVDAVLQAVRRGMGA